MLFLVEDCIDFHLDGAFVKIDNDKDKVVNGHITLMTLPLRLTGKTNIVNYPDRTKKQQGNIKHFLITGELFN